jgi:hypothetical protein
LSVTSVIGTICPVSGLVTREAQLEAEVADLTHALGDRSCPHNRPVNSLTRDIDGQDRVPVLRGGVFADPPLQLLDTPPTLGHGLFSLRGAG